MNARIHITPPPMPREWEDVEPPARDEQRHIHWVDHQAARLRRLLRDQGWKDWTPEVRIEP